MESVQEMIYVGNNSFSSKAKDAIYYVVQVLYNERDVSRGTNKATLINIFTDDKTYQKFVGSEVGSTVKVEVKPNMAVGKINYKIVG